MNKKDIKDAVTEAKRFLRRVDEYGDGIRVNTRWRYSQDGEYVNAEYKTAKKTEAGALRRASLDLSVSLAKLRRYD